uniref:Polynucleotide adenylyltransferase n=1 Tax=Ditylum brightwellii TaxID=49249 RepID=A0A7S4W113_9STRA|mmetsp:Transcript_5468/g.7162  ORF Transcript_5468/g.7162 Transcript_5468/m.7162 type:complete len:1374 (-) Transcript_5468:129-4250(-)
MSAPKIKLRTAGDVISRLRWSEEEDPAVILMGYDDRINGPMEKSIADYKSIDDGGDIPQHRIQYFRRMGDTNMNTLILWDREGRVDKLFGSGLGSEAPVSAVTIKMAFDAIANMKRIAEEQEIRRQEKAKMRARRQRQHRSKMRVENAALKNTNQPTENDTTTGHRFRWRTVDWYDFSSSKSWTKGDCSRQSPVKTRGSRQLRFVTWNVLFDKYNTQTVLFEGDTATNRWSLLIRLLGEADADLIALQEVTPQFLTLLCGASWVNQDYSVSAMPENTRSIEPHGNLLMWKKSSLQPVPRGLSLLVDGPRTRSIVACLRPVQEPRTVLMAACVHLPSDATAYDEQGETGERQSRKEARRRELNTIIAQLQTLEAQLQGAPTKSIVPILLGDFNSDENNRELENGGFMTSSTMGSNTLGGAFTDVWPIVSNGREGFTYHPTENKRASFSVRGPRRIDRICIGRSVRESVLLLHPAEGGLLGSNLPSRGEFPPSDHYGLSVLFDVPTIASSHPMLLQNQNLWASTVQPTTNTLLALTFGESPLRDIPLFDPESSLPVPHITLLNGFAELMCQESHDLAMQTIAIAVSQTLCTTNSCKVPFSQDSLGVFEHRSSASLVCKPDGLCEWLHTLYGILRAAFRFCDEQEKRFLEGWSPHISLGKFGSENDARREASRMLLGGSWFQGRCHLPAQAVVIYQRNASDRKFYAVASVPLQSKPQNIQACNPKNFLNDAGASFSSYFFNHSAPFVSNIERICQATISTMSDCLLEAKLKRYGSCNFHASMPAVSDIDAVVELSPKEGSQNDKAIHNFSARDFLQNVGVALKSIHSSAKIRMRVAGAGGVNVHLLTMKVTPQAPSVDLMVCLRTSDGETIDMMGAAASNSIKDGRMILDEVEFEYIIPNPQNTRFQPFMLLLCGIPGSGKSTIAKRLQKSMPYKYVRINQDNLGSLQLCEAKARQALANNACPIIDRCNFDREQRAHFISIAQEFDAPVDCLVLGVGSSSLVTVEECIERCQKRTNHPTIQADTAGEAITIISNMMDPPSARGNQEGLRHVNWIENISALDDFIARYLQKGCANRDTVSLPGVTIALAPAFEGALRLCKLWAYRRQVYGAPLGFLGGGGWALLIAQAMSEGLSDGSLQLPEMQERKTESSIKVLACFFGWMIAGWNQAIFSLEETRVCEETKGQAHSRGTIAVIAPASGGNYARNTTRSTTAVIQKEILRANAIIETCVNGEVEELFLPLQDEEFLLRGSLILFLEVDAGKLAKVQGSPTLAEVKPWANLQILQALVSLENEIGDVDLIRPSSRPTLIKRKLLYIVRVNKTVEDLARFMENQQRVLQYEADGFFNITSRDEENAFVRLRCLTVSRFCQAFDLLMH